MKKFGALGCIAIGLVVLLVILAFMAFTTYNSLVAKDENVNEAWAQVENQYQRRADLIPNLIRTVQGAADFERETLQNVIEARSRVGQINAGDITENPQAFERFQQAQDALSSALSRLMVVVERYPELKANQNFRDLQVQLEGTENRIAVERMRYNEVSRDFNTAVRRFPTNIFAGMFGFEPKQYFEAVEGSDVAPEVEFDFGS